MMTRDEFREAVFARDGGRCVKCGQPGVDAHHLIDRSLWPDGGYLLDNGVTLCAGCHLKAERTQLSCWDLRLSAGITRRIVPPGFSDINEYDHWGNVDAGGKVRHVGPLYDRPNVQKALSDGGVLGEFEWDVKYPRTYHFTFSPNVQNDDRMHTSDDLFDGVEVIGTTKMDGEGTTMTDAVCHARSLSSGPHPSRDWVRVLHGRIVHDIPHHWRVCGENMYAEHSIHYDHLASYFLVFSIWDERNVCLSWKDTVEFSALLGLETVPVFYVGAWDRGAVQRAYDRYCDGSPDPVEGYVVRAASSFRFESYAMHTAKWVRRNHVQTDQFWMSKPVVPNKLEPA